MYVYYFGLKVDMAILSFSLMHQLVAASCQIKVMRL